MPPTRRGAAAGRTRPLVACTRPGGLNPELGGGRRRRRRAPPTRRSAAGAPLQARAAGTPSEPRSRWSRASEALLHRSAGPARCPEPSPRLTCCNKRTTPSGRQSVAGILWRSGACASEVVRRDGSKCRASLKGEDDRSQGTFDNEALRDHGVQDVHHPHSSACLFS